MIAIPAFSERTWKIIGTCVVGLIVLGAVLFLIDRCGTYRFNRDIEKRKANVNAALTNIANREAIIANLNEKQAVEKQQVKDMTVDLLTAANTTNEVRAETDKALGNLANAKAGNATNVSVEALQEKLRRLEQ